MIGAALRFWFASCTEMEMTPPPLMMSSEGTLHFPSLWMTDEKIIEAEAEAEKEEDEMLKMQRSPGRIVDPWALSRLFGAIEYELRYKGALM